MAQATNRVGYFRKDTITGGRMGGEELTAFASGVYENLYGKGADISDMHGFMAGQTGQLMEDMFQRAAMLDAVLKRLHDEAPSVPTSAESLTNQSILDWFASYRPVNVLAAHGRVASLE
ncbi:MAG: hypothetical protein FGM27_09195, partial [Candidatus Omnitrophica bacterium]|nr:hypothetical protein [Candidatus Omnitrophota bacterium]